VPEFASVSTGIFAADIRTLGPGKVVHATELEKNPAKISGLQTQSCHGRPVDRDFRFPEGKLQSRP